MTNLMGEDRADALSAMHDDQEFDRWQEEYERKRARMEANMGKQQAGGGSKKPGRVSVSKEEFLKRMETANG